MANFLESVNAGYERCGVLPGKLLLAVSGGADSLALLLATLDLADQRNLTLHVAHLNHQLRDTANDDAQWLTELTNRLNLPLTVEEQNVAKYAERERLTVEESARKLRYEFLERTAVQCGSQQIAVAHHAGDQCETVLHHLFRGTALAGLRGMLPVRELSSGVRLLRPLLNISRASIENWLRNKGQDFLEDDTNLDTRYMRNRLRHELLPLLKRDYNQQVDQHLVRLAEQAREAQEALEWMAEQLLREALIKQTPTHCIMKIAPLQDVPRHLLRECFRLLWIQQSWSRQKMSAAHWNSLAELVVGGSAVTLPGTIQACQRRQQIQIESRPPEPELPL